jgi:hypothetical protein
MRLLLWHFNMPLKKMFFKYFNTHIQIPAFISRSDMCMISEIPPKFSSQILHPIFYYETVQFSPRREKIHITYIVAQKPWCTYFHSGGHYFTELFIVILTLPVREEPVRFSFTAWPSSSAVYMINESQVIYGECHLLQGRDDVILQ